MPPPLLSNHCRKFMAEIPIAASVAAPAKGVAIAAHTSGPAFTFHVRDHYPRMATVIHRNADSPLNR